MKKPTNSPYQPKTGSEPINIELREQNVPILGRSQNAYVQAPITARKFQIQEKDIQSYSKNENSFNPCQGCCVSWYPPEVMKKVPFMIKCQACGYKGETTTLLAERKMWCPYQCFVLLCFAWCEGKCNTYKRVEHYCSNCGTLYAVC